MISVVTSPDYYHVDQLSVMLFDVDPFDIKIITEAVLNSEQEHMTICIADSSSDDQWIVNTAKQVDYVVVNTAEESLMKGYILNFPNVMYYNNTYDITSLNNNQVDPIDFILRLINDS